MAPAPTFDVIVCGSLHLDIMVQAPHLPRRDETAVGQSWAQACGGKGGNQAVQAARLGARTAMIGRVGTDAFGARLMANLDSAGVDRTGVDTDPHAGSGMSVAIVDANGDYGAVIVSGANLAIDPQVLAAIWDRLGGARVLVLQNEIPHAVNVAAARAARRAGATVLFNAAPARDSGPDLLDLVDVLVINRVEADMLSGVRISDRPSTIAALPALGSGQRTVIVTLGGDGLVVAPAGAAPCEIAARPVAVVSTHGAGDCFVGALACRLAAGDGVVEACHVANAAAGEFVAKTGTPAC
jgi:ribokinase